MDKWLAENPGRVLVGQSATWWRVLIAVLANTGLRIGEALNLRWGAVELDSLPCRVRVEAVEGGSFQVDGVTYPIMEWRSKTRSSYRSVPLPGWVAELLRKWREAGDGSPYLFLSLARLGKLERRIKAGLWHVGDLPLSNVPLGFKAVQEAAGIELPRGAVHDCRDSFIARIKDHVSMDVVARMAGHSSITTTARFYTSAAPEDEVKVLDALGSGIRVAAGSPGDKAALAGA